ncbi:hypothetical protein C0992_004336 [Termitomyces sp. T32_za158]|nr:hypothetical protein C0992_004336 [Termitomyces sp. T32_za158]
MDGTQKGYIYGTSHNHVRHPSQRAPPQANYNYYQPQQQNQRQHGLQLPPGTDPQLWQLFSTVDKDRSGSISVTELQSALVNGKYAFIVFLVFADARNIGNWTSKHAHPTT